MKPISSHRATPKARSSASSQAHIADELRCYDEHLRDVRGLAAGTRKDRLYVAGMLLRQKFKDGVLKPSATSNAVLSGLQPSRSALPVTIAPRLLSCLRIKQPIAGLSARRDPHLLDCAPLPSRNQDMPLISHVFRGTHAFKNQVLAIMWK